MAKNPRLPSIEGAEMIFREEELRGDRFANRFRYFLILLTLPSVFLGAAGDTANIIINFVGLAVYLLVTLIHTLLLRREDARTLRVFSYVAISCDILLIFSIGIFYTLKQSPGNWSFLFKNPLMFLFFVGATFAIIQFRKRLMLWFAILTATITVGMIVFAIQDGMRLTTNWAEYMLGDKFMPGVFLANYFLVLGAFVFAEIYTRRRTKRMLERILDLEQKRASLSRYFSPAIATELMENPEVIEKGRRIKATILFADLRNFTALTERLSSEDLVRLLSDFRETMVEVLFDNNGTVDKFIGDAIMATFGTPRPADEPGLDTRNAIHAAQGMLDAIDKFNMRHGFKGEDRWEIGIGVHTGEVFAGNIGNLSTREYSVIGDPVNTASRIESLCKDFGKKLLISDEVFGEVGEELDVEKMEPVMVKGKSEPLQVYSVH